MLGAAGAGQVRSGPVAASQRFTPLGSLRLLHEHPEYRGLVLAWFVWGLGSFMAAPLYALVLVDRFQAGYAEVGVLQLVGAASGLLGYLVLVRGVAAPFIGSFAVSMGLGIGPTLVVSGLLGLVGAFIMARALGSQVPVRRVTLKALRTSPSKSLSFPRLAMTRPVNS